MTAGHTRLARRRLGVKLATFGVLCFVCALVLVHMKRYGADNDDDSSRIRKTGGGERVETVRLLPPKPLRMTPIPFFCDTEEQSFPEAPAPVFNQDNLSAFAQAYRDKEVNETVSLEETARLCEEFFGGTAFSLKDAGDELCIMMESDDPQMRISALIALCAFRRELGEDAPMGGERDAPDVESSQIDKIDEIEYRLTVNLVEAGLNDEKTEVRDTACAVLTTLPREERDALSIQLMGGSDNVLKAALLEKSVKQSDKSALMLNFHALDDDNAEIRDVANKNIKTMTGKTFESSAEAFMWLEAESRNR